MKTKEKQEIIENTSTPEISPKQTELQALKATAYEILVERQRLENILRQVEQRIQELSKPEAPTA